MALSRVTTEKVRERADIEDVVNDYVSLKKRGQNLWACCPFHNEKSPSFSVSTVKQIYKCFGCGKAGDPIQFVMDIEGIGFQDRKSTRLNSSHVRISYAVFCLKKKNRNF